MAKHTTQWLDVLDLINRGHVGVANLVTDTAHSWCIANGQRISVIETSNTRNCATRQID